VDAFQLPDAASISNLLASWRVQDPALSLLLASGTPAPVALSQIGCQWLNEGRATEAAAMFRVAVALDGRNPILWLNCGAALDYAGAPAEALSCVERSLKINPRQPEAWVFLGTIRKKQGEAAGAEAAYRMALKHNPQLPVAWQCLGLLKQELRNPQAAIDCFIECLRYGGTDAPTLANLGKLYYETGRIAEAADAYLRAAELDRNNAHYSSYGARARFMRDVLRGDPVETAMEACKSTDPSVDLSQLLESCFNYLNGFGQGDAARRIGGKYLELWPERPVMRYLMAALSGDSGLDRSPVEYVAEHFDAFAGKFDAQLEGVLHYDVPQKLCAAVRAAGDGYQYEETLDAGCGTGLCGPGLRPVTGRLAGVDLSAKMLEQARQRRIYDELICEEMTQFLERSPCRFDLIVAADVIIYIGNLRWLFSAAARALRAGGLFAFSIENGGGTAFTLLSSGRFAHAPGYVREVARADFKEVSQSEITIRLEANRPVTGSLFVLRRLGSEARPEDATCREKT
jgi:predicted TPR repeat methyltransferase